MNHSQESQTGSAKRTIESIPLSKTKIATSPKDATKKYQRDLSYSSAKNIAKDFDEIRLGLPVVSKRDGHYYIVDGQTRIASMKILGIKECICAVVVGWEYEDEAYYFYTQRDKNRGVDSVDTFNAMVEAGAPNAIEIHEILVKNGFRVSRGGGRKTPVTSIQAVNALLAIYKKHGGEILEETLNFVAKTWLGEFQAKRRDFLEGVSEFICICKKQDKWDSDKMRDKLVAHLPSKIILTAHSRVLSSDKVYQAITEVLKELYNHKRTKGSTGYIE